MNNFGLSKNAIKQFNDLYCLHGEDIEGAFIRVIKEFSKDKTEEVLAYDLLSKNIWRPNTPVWLNAGTKHKIFSACFVAELRDSMNSIYDIANVGRKIFQFGSGIGIPIGNLRESEAYIYEGNPDMIPEGRTSGPLTFAKLFDAVGETTKSGGRVRRAAILCLMLIWHPDIMSFIECKQIDGNLSNMNISVGITDKFMQCLEDKVPFDLLTPYDGSKVGEIDPHELWDKLSANAYNHAEPGVVFIDTVNKWNPLIKKILIECCNPSLRKGTRVLTNGGIFKIEELEDKSFKLPSLENNSCDAICRLSGKNKTLYKINLVGNHSYYATKEHKWPVFDENGNIYKKRTIDLKEGDMFPKPLNENLGYGNEGEYSDGFLIGWNLGDGWITKRKDNDKIQFGLIISEKDVNSGIKDILSEKLNSITNRKYNPTPRNGNIEINTSCKEIEKYIDKFEVQNKEKGLSDFIWKRSSEEFRKGLIDGLFSSDGTVNKKNNRIRFYSSKQKLCKDLSELLGFYGLKTFFGTTKRNNITFPNGKNYNKEYTLYYLELNHYDTLEFKKIFKLSHKEKQLKLEKIESPKKIWKKSKNITVISIEKTDIKEDVWDISVFDESHTFRISYSFTGNCGEQFLISFGACNLSAINIAKFVNDGEFDWMEFYKTSFDIMGLMDNLIDVMEFPDERFKENTLKYRPVGIGPMGLSDAMYKLGIKYDSPDGRKFAGDVMRAMTTACAHKSALIAKENGPFFEYDIHKDNVERIINSHTDSNEEVMALVKKYGVANCQFTTAQPTGTTALSCDASYGIEPMFGLVFQKNYIDGKNALFVNPIFKEKFKNEPWFTDDLLDKIHNNKGSLKGLHGIPKEVREVFVVAHDIKWKDRIDMQSDLQKYCSNAISSTVNLPKNSTKEEVSEMLKYAHKKELKGLTIYRDGSKKGQPVTFEQDKITDFKRPKKLISNTYIVETGNGKMYVTVCDYKGKPLEIFIHIGKSGQILNTFTESLGRVISIAFQNGVPVEGITKTLININSDRSTWFRFEENDKKPDQILSIPDGIAKLLNRYYTGMQYEGELSFEICEMCGNSMNATEGCFSCPSCGHSKCS